MAHVIIHGNVFVKKDGVASSVIKILIIVQIINHVKIMEHVLILVKDHIHVNVNLVLMAPIVKLHQMIVHYHPVKMVEHVLKIHIKKTIDVIVERDGWDDIVKRRL